MMDRCPRSSSWRCLQCWPFSALFAVALEWAACSGLLASPSGALTLSLTGPGLWLPPTLGRSLAEATAEARPGRGLPILGFPALTGESSLTRGGITSCLEPRSRWGPEMPGGETQTQVATQDLDFPLTL